MQQTTQARKKGKTQNWRS